MNKRQKNIVTNFAIVIAVTAVAVVAMVELKNSVNRSEAMRAMEHLGQIIFKYRQDNGIVPPESYVDAIKKELQGGVRLGKLYYRARWIDLDSTPDEILAYAGKQYHSLLFRSGYVVLRFDGRIEWMDKKTFETLLTSQQSPLEIEMTKE